MSQLKPVIVIPDDINRAFECSDSLQQLKNMAEVRVYTDRAKNDIELINRIKDANIVVSFRPAFTRFPASCLQACKQLQLICISGTGVEDVDVKVASEMGVAVANVVGASNLSVAELCIGFMFALSRRIAEQHAAIIQGQWNALTGFELHGKTLGIIGLSGISKELIKMAAAFGMRVISWSRNNDAQRALEAGCQSVELDELLEQSDLISMHLRLNSETRHFLNKQRIAAMKPGALLINTARGGLIDEQAMIEALQSGHLAGAGLDVFSVEPLPADSMLRKMNNVVMTPVSAWNTRESSQRMIDISISNVIDFLKNEPKNIVNREML
jgi:D-3-phosphoglycerate dehydrogenase